MSSDQIVVTSVTGMPMFNSFIQFVLRSSLARRHADQFVYVGPQLTPGTKQSLYDIQYKQYTAESIPREIASDLSRPKFVQHPLEGKLFRISVLGGAVSWIQFTTHPDGTISGSGPQYRLLVECSRRLNFTYSLRYASNGGASGYKKDGAWYGAVGDLVNNSADIVVGGGISTDRNFVVDGGVPIERITRVFHMRMPPVTTNLSPLYRSFQASVWILIAVVTLFFIPVLYFQMRKLSNSRDLFWEVINDLLGIVLEQNIKMQSWKGAGPRTVVLMLVLFGLVMTAGYRSQLIYFLTFVSRSEVRRKAILSS